MISYVSEEEKITKRKEYVEANKESIKESSKIYNTE
jgi:hypothetical protein